jgi:hypothetical protein
MLGRSVTQWIEPRAILSKGLSISVKYPEQLREPQRLEERLSLNVHYLLGIHLSSGRAR